MNRKQKPATTIIGAILYCAAPQLPADQFGRLFTTPMERDALRSGVKLDAQATSEVRLDGLVVKARDKLVGWINSQSLDKIETQGGDVKIAQSSPAGHKGSNTLKLPLLVGEKTLLRLKPGQTWSADDNRVRESMLTSRTDVPADADPQNQPDHSGSAGRDINE